MGKRITEETAAAAAEAAVKDARPMSQNAYKVDVMKDRRETRHICALPASRPPERSLIR